MYEPQIKISSQGGPYTSLHHHSGSNSQSLNRQDSSTACHC